MNCNVCNNKGYVIKNNKVVTCLTCYEKKRKLARLLKSNIPPQALKNFTFNNFRTEKDHHKKMAKLFKKWFDVSKENGFTSSILISAPTGAGKSHFAIAALEQVAAYRDIYYIRYLSDIYIPKTYRIHGDEELLIRLSIAKNTDVLCIDDIQPFLSNEHANMFLFDIIDYRYLTKKPVIVTTRLPVDEFLNSFEALASRIIEMANGFVLEIKDSDNERIKQ